MHREVAQAIHDHLKKAMPNIPVRMGFGGPVVGELESFDDAGHGRVRLTDEGVDMLRDYWGGEGETVVIAHDITLLGE